MNAPTFILPACPLCSTIVEPARPSWRNAANTSEKRGSPCFIFVGCKHALEIGEPFAIHDGPEAWGIVEDAWTERARQLFEARTETWTPEARDRLRRELQSGFDIAAKKTENETEAGGNSDRPAESGGKLPPATNHEPNENDD